MGNTNSTTALAKHSKYYLKYQNEFCRNIVVAYSVNITKLIVKPELARRVDIAGTFPPSH